MKTYIKAVKNRTEMALSLLHKKLSKQMEVDYFFAVVILNGSMNF